VDLANLEMRARAFNNQINTRQVLPKLRANRWLVNKPLISSSKLIVRPRVLCLLQLRLRLVIRVHRVLAFLMSYGTNSTRSIV